MESARTHLPLVLGLLLSAGLSSCSEPSGPAEPPISGIVRTYENGQIYEEDTLDWYPRMHQSSGGGSTGPFVFIPAAPNPSATTTTFGCALNTDANVRVWAVNKKGETVATITDSHLAPGQYSFTWSFGEGSGTRLPAGLYRVYFEIKYGSDSKGVKSFGDVEVTE